MSPDERFNHRLNMPFVQHMTLKGVGWEKLGKISQENFLVVVKVLEDEVSFIDSGLR
jgi:hypothetical protein